jgi:Superinfection immunity protein
MVRVPLGVPIGCVAVGLMVLAGPASAQAAGEDYSFGIHMMILSLCLMPGLYFLPSILAATRDHPAANSIFTVNLLLGWTVVGWLVALVWTLRANPQALAPVVQTTPQPSAPKPSLVDVVAQEIEDLARQKLQLQLSEDEYNQRKKAILDRWKAHPHLTATLRL